MLALSLLLLSCTSPAHADAASMAWVKRMESTFFGRIFQGAAIVKVSAPEFTRELEGYLWVENRRRFLIKFTDPSRDRNSGILRDGSSLLEYHPISFPVPREPDPESRWIGSELRTTDLKDTFTFSENYDAKAGAIEKIEADKDERVRALKLVLSPRKKKPAAWPKVELWVKQPDGALVRAVYYDAEGRAVREIRGSRFREYGPTVIPTRLRIRNPGSGNELDVLVKYPVLDQLVQPTAFTRKGLETPTAELTALPPVPKKKKKKVRTPTSSWPRR